MMGEELLSGVVEEIVFSQVDTGFTVLRVRQRNHRQADIVIGTAQKARIGHLIRAEGTWQEDRSWGRQFRASHITLLPPRDHEALVAFLASGIIRGVGDTLARKLVEAFGDDLVHTIEHDPDHLKTIQGVGPKLAGRIATAWRDERGSRDILMFLHTNGIRPARARRILERYGGDAVSHILKDPYLLARDIRGIGFQTADQLASRIGIAKDAPVRRLAALVETLRQAAEDGHSFTTKNQAIADAARLLGVDPPSLADLAEAAVTDRRLAQVDLEGQSLLALPDLRAAEEEVATGLHRLAQGMPPWGRPGDTMEFDTIEKKLDLSLATSQRDALTGVLASKVAVVTGGPGTGKTTLVRAIVEALASNDVEIALAAPTGRAARRMTESTGRPASTLHRLLEADPGRGFNRDSDRPLECDVLILDEVSMVDILLMQAVLAALPDETALILVGDVDQLPSVGPGQILHDILQSLCLPVFTLKEIFRQAAESGIVSNAHRVIAGEMPAFKGLTQSDCFGIRTQDAADATERIVELMVDRIPERFGFDPFTDIQLLCPVNRGPAGTRELNNRLQQELNPTPDAMVERRGLRFASGDKIMQIENDHNREVYNGDIGRIMKVDHRAKQLEVAFDDRTLTYGFDALDQLQPAFAITVHKAQGSEYPAVVLLLLREHGRMLRRQLLYTAMTRARKLLVVVAQPQALGRAVNTPQPPRRSLLVREIQAVWQSGVGATGEADNSADRDGARPGIDRA